MHVGARVFKHKDLNITYVAFDTQIEHKETKWNGVRQNCSI